MDNNLRKPVFRRLQTVLQFRAPEAALTLNGLMLVVFLVFNVLGQIIDIENPENTAPNLRWLHGVSETLALEGLVLAILVFYYTGLTIYYRIRAGGRRPAEDRSVIHARMEWDIYAYDALIWTLIEGHESYFEAVRRIAPEAASVGDWVESDLDWRFERVFPRRKT
ncbi:MAG: hypothetical protein OXD31_13730 [Chloroflexi bacterium]|nr:hypothetical protein [Chloroflexota bacterium]